MKLTNTMKGVPLKSKTAPHDDHMVKGAPLVGGRCAGASVPRLLCTGGWGIACPMCFLIFCN